MLGFGNKCAFCREKIEKGKEIKKAVKRPGYVGTFTKNFCSEEHANTYEKQAENECGSQKSGGGCCG